MQLRPLGKTGLEVSALGLGTGGLGQPELMESNVSRVLDRALELGVTLIDAARSYGLAEARLGRHLGKRRSEVVISTKGGYGVDGVADWSGEAITLGIHRALRQLRTDYIDIFLLHSCPLEVLQQAPILEALEKAHAAGKIRVAGYAGENDALAWAVRSGHFGVVECSVNVVDQKNLGGLIEEAKQRGIGVIAKRPLANAVWAHAQIPAAGDAAIYWSRLQKLKLDPAPLSWLEVAMRFSAYAPGVDSAIAGCRTLAHLEANEAAVARGPLSPAMVEAIRATFLANGAGWDGII